MTEKNQITSISTCQSPHLLLLPLYLQLRHQVGLPVKRVRCWWPCLYPKPNTKYLLDRELGSCVNNLTTECSPSTSWSVHVAFTTPCHRSFIQIQEIMSTESVVAAQQSSTPSEPLSKSSGKSAQTWLLVHQTETLETPRNERKST